MACDSICRFVISNGFPLEIFGQYFQSRKSNNAPIFCWTLTGSLKKKYQYHLCVPILYLIVTILSIEGNELIFVSQSSVQISFIPKISSSLAYGVDPALGNMSIICFLVFIHVPIALTEKAGSTTLVLIRNSYDIILNKSFRKHCGSVCNFGTMDKL